VSVVFDLGNVWRMIGRENEQSLGPFMLANVTRVTRVLQGNLITVIHSNF